MTTDEMRGALGAIRDRYPSYPSPGEDPVAPFIAAIQAGLDAFDAGATGADVIAAVGQVLGGVLL